MPSANLAMAANELLEKAGINFAISFDTATCDRIRAAKRRQKDPDLPFLHGVTLKSVDVDSAYLSLPEPSFFSPECGGCQVKLPILQMTATDFITIISGNNIRFHLPPVFLVDTAVLLDPRDNSDIIRTWRIPFRGKPIGVSFDENVLYLGFEDPELSDLSLMIFGDGVFQIATRTEAEIGGPGRQLDTTSTEKSISTDRILRFDRWGKTFLVGFKNRCST